MLQPLLQAKLTPPLLPHGLVPRDRLVARLSDPRAQVVTVVAPAGFGKTTVLLAWLAARMKDAGSGSPFILPPSSVEPAFAWLALDERDNDPTRFWGYLIGAIDRVAPGSGDHARSMLQSPTPPPAEVIVGALLAELGQWAAPTPERGAAPLTLVIDDYQAIEHPAIHAGLTFFVESLPPGVRLVIAGRSEPPLPLGKLRMRGQLAELRADDLRFTSGEIAALLRAHQVTLAPADLAALEARTEGWPGALQLAALSLREGPDPQQLIAGFSGAHRHLLDYLAEEVLRRQPAHIRRFLLRTSVLDQLCAGLCDLLLADGTGGGDATLSPSPVPSAHTILDHIERAGLFLIPLDPERRWYRYHSLFAEFLRERLAREEPGSVAELHRRAARWYAAEGMPVEAVGHVLAAGDTAQAVELIERHGRALLLRSEVATVLGWLAALPAELVRGRPTLGLTSAWGYALAGQFEAAEAPLRAAEAALLPAPEPAPDLDTPTPLTAPYTPRNLLSEALAVRATIAGLRRETAQTIGLARRALEALPDDSVIVRGVVGLMLGTSAYLSGDFAGAAEALQNAEAAGAAGGMPIIAIFALRQLGELHGRAGQLHRAAATYQRAIDLGAQLYPRRDPARERPVPVAGTAYVGLGLIHYEWGRLESAAELLGRGVYLGRQGANVEIMLMGPIGLARVQQARGEREQARATLREAMAFARATGVPRLAAWIGAEQARLALALGDVADAAAWDQERQLDPAGPISYLEEIDYLALAQLRSAQGQPMTAVRLLARLRALAEEQGRDGSLIEILALTALACRAAGDSPGAHAALERALALAEPEGYQRTFLDLGDGLARLLAELAVGKGAQAGYARRLLETYNSGAAAEAGPAAVQRTPIAALAEQPTPRELEVLGWIAAGLSNEAIADKLVVSLSTVKKHINNLYAKLEVVSRTQALKKARELGIIE